LADASPHILDRLYAVIDSRRGDDPATSRTARLFQKGPAKIAQKLGEEAVEAAIAALVEPRERLVAESADLLYHLLVLWAAQGVRPEEVWRELESRAALPAAGEGD
jgi:phosphoribosyl-ATP pyrophosphohydrolase